MPKSFLSTFRRRAGPRLARLVVRATLDTGGDLPSFRTDAPTRAPSPHTRPNLGQAMPIDRFRLSRSQAERLLLRALLRGRKDF